MVLFMYYGIKSIICYILKIIVEPDVLLKVKKPNKWKGIDLTNENNLIKPGEMSIEFAVDWDQAKSCCQFSWHKSIQESCR